MADSTDAYDVTTLSDQIYQGEGKWFKFTFTQDDVAVDLTDAEFAFSIKKSLADAAYEHEATYPGDFDENLKSTGIVRVNLPASVSSAMAVGSYYGELLTTLVEDTDVDKKLIKFKVKQAVTP